MRTLAALPLLAAAACLSAPTGTDPTSIDAPSALAWPPTGADIRAAAGGDVTGDGVDDLVVVDVGRMRVYLLRGGTDVGTAGSATATTYALETPIADLRGPVAVTIVPGRIVVLDNPASGARLTVLDATLTVTGTTQVSPTPATGNATIWLRASPFGQSQLSVFAAVPGTVGFVEASDLSGSAPPFKRFNDETFAAPVLAGGYLPNGQMPKLYAAEPTRALRADTNGPTFTWTIQRNAEAWAAQTVADLGGDPAPELVGIDTAGSGARVCVIDVGGGTLPTCLAVPYMMDSNMSIEVAELNVAGKDDLVVFHPQATNASVFILPDLRVMANAVAASGPGGPQVRNVPAAVMAILQVVPGGTREIMLIGSTGVMACLHASGADAVDC